VCSGGRGVSDNPGGEHHTRAPASICTQNAAMAGTHTYTRTHSACTPHIPCTSLNALQGFGVLSSNTTRSRLRICRDAGCKRRRTFFTSLPPVSGVRSADEGDGVRAAWGDREDAPVRGADFFIAAGYREDSRHRQHTHAHVARPVGWADDPTPCRPKDDRLHSTGGYPRQI
jgi:hypothetical protein